MIQTTRVEILHPVHVGMAREKAYEVVLRLGGVEKCAQAAATVAGELAANIVKHTPGGEILFGELKEGSNCGLDLHALDTGLGIRNVATALRGYSPSGASMTGLVAVKQLAEEFQVHTHSSQGTVVWARCGINRLHPPEKNFDYGGVCMAMPGEEVCGDAWDIRESPHSLRVILVDGLGHGPLAAEASGKAIRIFQNHLRPDLPECLRAIHHGLTNTRGAAATLASINSGTGGVIVAGIGNVSARILTRETTKTFAGDNGTLGAGIRKITEFNPRWDKDSVLVLHSDGISSRWDCSRYPGLEGTHPALIAGVLYRDFRHRHDDATVVVVRQRRNKPEHSNPADRNAPLPAVNPFPPSHCSHPAATL